MWAPSRSKRSFIPCSIKLLNLYSTSATQFHNGGGSACVHACARVGVCVCAVSIDLVFCLFLSFSFSFIFWIVSNYIYIQYRYDC